MSEHLQFEYPKPMPLQVVLSENPPMTTVTATPFPGSVHPLQTQQVVLVGNTGMNRPKMQIPACGATTQTTMQMMHDSQKRPIRTR
jgi:hypothetical protein